MVDPTNGSGMSLIEFGFYDCMIEDAFAYRSRKLLERIKQCEKDQDIGLAA
jgi:hypothetical protein